MAKTVLGDGIIDTIRDWIIQGELQPGEPLAEERLAAKLAVSRTPVRESLRKLSDEGFVELLAHRGARVVRPDAEFVREVLEVREALEGVAARTAATSLAPYRLQYLHELFDHLRYPVSQGNLSDIGEGIHDEVLGACNNGTLRRLAEVYSNKSAWIRRIAEEVPGRLVTSFREHQGILCALDARDPEWAEVAIRAHIRSALHDILEAISRRERERALQAAKQPRLRTVSIDRSPAKIGEVVGG